MPFVSRLELIKNSGVNTLISFGKGLRSDTLNNGHDLGEFTR